MDREKLQDISRDIKRVAGNHGGGMLLSGKVVAGTLDEVNLTVDVALTVDDAVETGDADDVPTAEVLLGAVSIKNDGVVLHPADGSDVVVGEVDGPGTYVVVRCSELVKLEVIVGDSKVKVVDGLVEFNEGGHGGLVQIKELKDNLDTLKDYIKNTLEPAIGSGFTAVGAAMASNGANGKTAFDLLVQPQAITIKDMENTKVTHG